MTRGFHAAAALALLAQLGAGTAAAQAPSRPGASGVLDVAVPERAAAMRILAEARARLVDALDGDRDISLGPAPDVLLEQAIERYDVVLAARPGDFDAWLERGRALAAFQRTMADGREVTRIADAIASYERARAIDPDRDAGHVAFELAVLRTRDHDYAGAEAEYERAYRARSASPMPITWWPSQRELVLALIAVPSAPSTILSNWAEVTMLAGDALSAITRYRAVIAEAPDGDTASLALWGLALAQERSGGHRDAMESALRAMESDHSRERPQRSRVVDRYGPFAVLHLAGVFFEPPCEIHAYESLGHEALATRAATPEGRAAEWTAARLSVRFFLAEGGRSSPYADVATTAEARLDALLGS